MKNVLLITDVHFWRPGAGHRTKIAHLVSFLATHVNLFVAFVLPPFKTEDDKNEIEKKFSIRITFLSDRIGAPLKKLGNNLKQLLASNKMDCCIIEFIHLSVFLRFIDLDMIKILDTHDISTDKAISFKEFNYRVFSMSEKTEIELFKIFDYVMSICEPDYQRLKELIPEKKIINVPHAPVIHYTAIKESVINVGFIGNAFTPNIEGIWYFIRECWNDILKIFPYLHLNIFGYVGDTLNNWEVFRYKNIHLKGYIPDINKIYDEIDIAINPVQFGAGIKIKSLEAMAYGKPLITTPHSARGLESGKDEAYLIAKNKTDFVKSIERLVSDFPYRKNLCERALLYIKENFNADKCYEPLLNVINN